MARAELPVGEAQTLLLHVLERDRAWYFAHADEPVGANIEARFVDLTARRQRGSPVAYLVGHREFWSLDLTVNPAVLIPRPDTELLVSWGVELAGQHQCQRLLDLGTGSGAVALALATELPGCQIAAVDVSQAALAVAAANGQRLGLSNVTYRRSDWFADLPGEQWPLIVSNPPYICADDPHLLQGDLPAEPRSALVGGTDGLDCIRAIISSAAAHLVSPGWLLLEHGWQQAFDVRRLLGEGGFTAVASRRDLAGHERVSGGRLL